MIKCLSEQGKECGQSSFDSWEYNTVFVRIRSEHLIGARNMRKCLLGRDYKYCRGREEVG
jgi:hypothetical protein